MFSTHCVLQRSMMRSEPSPVLAPCAKSDAVAAGRGIALADNSTDSEPSRASRRSACGSPVSRISSAALRLCAKNNPACSSHSRRIAPPDSIALNETPSLGSSTRDISHTPAMCSFGPLSSPGFDDQTSECANPSTAARDLVSASRARPCSPASEGAYRRSTNVS